MTHSPMTTIDDDRWQVGEGIFIFTLHDWRDSGLRRPRILTTSGDAPTTGSDPQKTKRGAGVGVFLNDSWKLPDFCAKPGVWENPLAQPCFGSLDTTRCECTI